ncbi:hypothetical protein GWP85_04695 [Acinetobacter beijerinckii]|uniref:hypothetical protein n=1 Tax=Acinetobacter beijerinckii TaxID=262668 RepID=UPI0023DD6B1C|nr:hypothetical protein [Acinetobacter beijerinckii]MDF2416817.1 hypothetical protein [Acinetobacter beijerinckii]
MVLKQIPIILLFIFLLGCKEKRVEDFKYEFFGSKLCALKTSDMKAANEFGQLDSSFKYKENIFDEKLSADIYEESLKNLSNKKAKYIFCLDSSKVKHSSLETQIRLEIKKGKYLRRYEFVNHSCLSKVGFILNISKDETVKCN